MLPNDHSTSNTKWPEPTCAPELIAAMETEPDPLLWHALIVNLNFDNPATFAIFEWILRRPDCDRATVVSFLGLPGVNGLEGVVKRSGYPELDTLFDAICETCANAKYSSSFRWPAQRAGLKTPTAARNVMVKAVSGLSFSEAELDWKVPWGLVEENYPSRPMMPTYYVDECTIQHASELKQHEHYFSGLNQLY